MTQTRLIATLLVAVIMGNVSSIADTIQVPGDFPTIQEAIEASSSGDLIEVAAGTYQISEPLDPLGKAIEIRGALSEDGTPLTLIDGAGTTRILVIQNNETSETIFRNLDLRNGFLTGFGSLVRVVQGSPLFEDCHFRGGQAVYKGGGFLVENDSDVVFRRCRFQGNSCLGGGGAIFVDGTSMVLIEDSVIKENTAGVGAGLYINGLASASLMNTKICGNTTDQVDGNYEDLGGNEISDTCECETGDLDSDADGTPDCLDECPEDPEKTEPGD